MKIRAIAESLVNDLIKRSNELGQGRKTAAIGYADKDGVVNRHSSFIEGGVSGIPHRVMMGKIDPREHASLLEMINSLPDSAVYVVTDPGQTGLITSTSAINLLNLPIIKIGIKHGERAGIGILHPGRKHFRLTTRNEKLKMESLAASTMEEEKEALRKVNRLKLKFLDISQVLESFPVEAEQENRSRDDLYSISRQPLESLAGEFARELVDKSLNTEPGREVAAYGRIDENGHITRSSEMIVGGMGYIPSRLLASAYEDIEGLSLREFYTDIIPENTAIVHTHPGGSGVMHMSDAMAGPGTWGRPIVAVGHDRNGNIKGVTAIRKSDSLFELADENEKLEQEFFQVENPEAEAKLRKRRYRIAQKFTDLCRELELRR